MEIIEKQQPREFKEERFEFAIFVNDNLICKRNFRINNYIKGSMQSIDFKYAVDDIVEMIDNDLKSKSRIYTWHYFDEADQEPNEFNQPRIEPWESTFKFVIYDDKKEVISKIWDGSGYQRAIRDRVDLTNKYVKITTKDGRTYTFDKDKYFAENEDRLTIDQYILKQMLAGKQDVLLAITKKICENCSPRENGFKESQDYTSVLEFSTRDFKRDADGKAILEEGKPVLEPQKRNKKKYFLSTATQFENMAAEWGQWVSEKTKEYKNAFYKA